LTLEARENARCVPKGMGHSGRYKFDCKANRANGGTCWKAAATRFDACPADRFNSHSQEWLCHRAWLVEKWRPMLDFGVTLTSVKDTCRG
jgi:hypothetical protein